MEPPTCSVGSSSASKISLLKEKVKNTKTKPAWGWNAVSQDKTKTARSLYSNLNVDYFFPRQLFKISEQGGEEIAIVFKDHHSGGSVNARLAAEEEQGESSHLTTTTVLAWGGEEGPSWGSRDTQESIPQFSVVMASHSQATGSLSRHNPICSLPSIF